MVMEYWRNVNDRYKLALDITHGIRKITILFCTYVTSISGFWLQKVEEIYSPENKNHHNDKCK
jgi:CRISPR-associated DxTHG motif protein